MGTSNLDTVTRELDALQERYGEAPVEREDPPFEAPPDVYRAMVEAAHEGTVNANYMWVRRGPDQFPGPSASIPEAAATSTRVLFIYNRADDHTWTIPGGGLEPGESFADAAHCELAEETGIEAAITGLRNVQHKVAVPSEEGETFALDEVHALHVVFDAEYEGGELDIQPQELYGAAWFDRVPRNRHDLVANLSIGADRAP